MPARVAYIARNDGTDMRVNKECDSLRRAGYELLFIGWAKKSNTPSSGLSDINKSLYQARSGAGSAWQAVEFPLFLLHCYKKLREFRPDVVHCVNEDQAMPYVVLRKLLGFKVICDLFDSIELKWGARRFPIGLLARAAAGIVHRKADALIVTDERRRSRISHRTEDIHIVSNYPVDIGEDVARQIPPSTGPTKLYVGGTLDKFRGLDQICSAAEIDDDIRVIAAGWVLDSSARSFIQHPKVSYLGVITPAESLAEAGKCHAIIALYEPLNENNILASPNKIYDALCVGRPVIINREAVVSEWVLQNGIGLAVDYGDAEDLAKAVEIIRSRQERMDGEAARLREFFRNGYSWSQAEKGLLTAYDTLLNGEESVPGRFVASPKRTSR